MSGKDSVIGSTVHPHVRGDYFITLPPTSIGNGSPPRAWGLPKRRQNRLERPRFTPTCVGTTHLNVVSGSVTTVHPHVRGDCGQRTSLMRDPSGSPPRAWGLPALVDVGERAFRFTPTCVGTTIAVRTKFSSISVHPHVRGDYKIADLAEPPVRVTVHPHVRGDYDDQ